MLAFVSAGLLDSSPLISKTSLKRIENLLEVHIESYTRVGPRNPSRKLARAFGIFVFPVIQEAIFVRTTSCHQLGSHSQVFDAVQRVVNF